MRIVNRAKVFDWLRITENDGWRRRRLEEDPGMERGDGAEREGKECDMREGERCIEESSQIIIPPFGIENVRGREET